MGLKLNAIIVLKGECEVKDDFIDSGDSNVYCIEDFLYFVVGSRYSTVLDDFLNLESHNRWVFFLNNSKIGLIGLLFEI